MSNEIVIDDNIDIVTMRKHVLFTYIEACLAGESLLFELLPFELPINLC